MSGPQPGDVMVTATGGWVASGIRWAEGKPRFTSPWLFWLFWLRQPAKVNHVAVNLGDGTVMEGRPSGAGTAPIDEYPDATWLNLPMPDVQRPYVILAARAMKGTRYGWLNCLAIGLVRVFGWKAPAWALRILKSRRWEECAQLGDAVINDSADAYERNNPGHKGLRLFKDGRPEGLVSPDDIYEEWAPDAHLQA